MRHKVHVYSVRDGGGPLSGEAKRLWYVGCIWGEGCGWEPDTLVIWPDGHRRYARRTWKAAFALALEHLREVSK